MQLWRLYPERFRETAFSGVGGLYVASRWNHLGTEMVYCATSPALAALELFVNLDPIEVPVDLLMAAVEIPDDQIEQILTIIEKNPDFFKKMGEEVQHKIKSGMSQEAAMQAFMSAHKDELKTILGK